MAKMFYEVQEAAEKLGKSADEIQAMVSSGELQEFRVDDRLVVKAEQVDMLSSDDDDLNIGLGESAIGLDDSEIGASGIGLAESGADASAIDLAAESALPDLAMDDDIGASAISDAGASGSIGLDGSGIGIEPESAPAEGAADAGGGVSIFDDDDLDSDPGAATLITEPGAAELDLTNDQLDAVGSGSGLLDLTREGDDTSLGVDLLQDVYDGDQSGEGTAAVDQGESAGGGLFEETTEAADSDLAPVAAPIAVEEVFDGGGSGLVGGLALVMVIGLLFTGVLTLLGLSGAGGEKVLAGPLAGGSGPMIVAGSIAGAALVVGVLGWVIGRKL